MLNSMQDGDNFVFFYFVFGVKTLNKIMDVGAKPAIGRDRIDNRLGDNAVSLRQMTEV